MLIEEFDLAIVNALGDFLSNLMWAAALDHVQPGPPVLSLGAGRRSYKESVLELAL